MSVRPLPEIISSASLIDYRKAIDIMAQRLAAIKAGQAGELIWFLEHPPVITLGVRGKAHDVLENRFPVVNTSRGGQATYHGPGQLVVYIMLDLNQRGPDIRAFVADLEQMIIDTLGAFGITGMRREGRVGVWVNTAAHDSGEAKIAAIGVRISRWVTYHGISLNIAPDLSHYESLVPCGLGTYGITSMEALGIKACRQVVETEMIRAFKAVF